MTDGLVSLDQWISDIATYLRGKDRQNYIYFQNSWIQGHLTNALLFPIQQSPADWREHFAWFQLLESFTPVDHEALITLEDESSQPKDVSDKAPHGPRLDLSRPAISEKSTPMPTGTRKPGQDQSKEDMEDLDLLIQENQGGLPPHPAPPVKEVATGRLAGQPVQKADHTVIVGLDGQGPDQDNLGTLVMEHRAKSGPDSLARGQRGPATEAAPQKAMISGSDKAPAKSTGLEGTKSAAAKTKEKQTEVGQSKPPESPDSQELNLDLDDLEVMDWNDKK